MEDKVLEKLEELLSKLKELESKHDRLETKSDRQWALVRPAIEKLMGE